MSRRITFDFDVRRFVNASAYIVERCPDVTKVKLSKLLYFADKEHLLSYGEPVIGDRYIKMEFGPVPSSGYDLMKHDERASTEDQALFDHYLSEDGNDIALRRPANLRCLSVTDREVLDDVILKYGHLTPARLSKLSHDEPAWKNASMNGEMDYRLFFAGSECAQGVQSLVEDDQALKDALEDIKLGEFLDSLRP